MAYRHYVLVLAVIAGLLAGSSVAWPSDTFDLPGGATIEMVWIEPGTFMMGTTEEQEQLLRSKGLWDDGFEDEQPAHEVTISHGF